MANASLWLANLVNMNSVVDSELSSLPVCGL